MKRWVAAIGCLILTAWATTALAYVVEITTSIELAKADDDAQLRDAVKAALDDVVHHVIAFAPTVVTVEGVRVVGDRIYILVLVADEDGEKTLQAMSTVQRAPGDSNVRDHPDTGERD